MPAGLLACLSLNMWGVKCDTVWQAMYREAGALQVVAGAVH